MLPRPFHYAHARAEYWRDAARSCLDQMAPLPAEFNLGFLYVSDLYGADMAAILAYVKEESGVVDWVGSLGVGICATGREYEDEPAMAMMAAEFPAGSFAVFSGSDQAAQSLPCGERPNFAIVHADSHAASVRQSIVVLAQKMESGFLVGGLTSSRSQHLQIANEVTQGGISGVAFSALVPISTRHTQGCTPIGPAHVITESDRNILITLDGRPTLDVFEEEIGEVMARNMSRVAGYIFVGLPIPGSDTGDYVVRSLIGIDPRNRMLAISDVPEPGSTLRFCRRDGAAAREDMVRMLSDLARDLPGPPRGGVYYSCLGRGAHMFGADSAELELIRQVIGEFPLVGFFANGEISHNRLYGYTGVLTLFT